MGVSEKPVISSNALYSPLSLPPTAAINLMHTTRLAVQISARRLIDLSVFSFLPLELNYKAY